MRVKLSARARRDFRNIRSHIDQDNPRAAVTVARSIRDAMRIIADEPLAFSLVDDGPYRMKIVARYGYKIFYEIRDEIEVVHIRHPSRSPDWR